MGSHRDDQKHLSYEDRLRELGLVQLGEDSMEISWKKTDFLHSLIVIGQGGMNGFKQKEGRLRLDGALGNLI